MLDRRTLDRMFDYTIKKILEDQNSSVRTKWDKFVAWKVALGLKKGELLDANEPSVYRQLRHDFNLALGDNKDDI